MITEVKAASNARAAMRISPATPPRMSEAPSSVSSHGKGRAYEGDTPSAAASTSHRGLSCTFCMPAYTNTAPTIAALHHPAEKLGSEAVSAING